MAIKYMFLPSVGGDRKYTTVDISAMFEKIFTSGVFDGIENLQVHCNGNDRVVRVRPGGGILKGRMFYEDGIPEVIFTPDAADATYDRVDRVIARLDLQTSGRDVSILYRQGAVSATPAPPECIDDIDEFEVPIAKIVIRAGSTTIIAGDIHDERDTVACGRVKCTAPTVSENFGNVKATGDISADGDVTTQGDVTASGVIMGAIVKGAVYQ